MSDDATDRGRPARCPAAEHPGAAHPTFPVTDAARLLAPATVAITAGRPPASAGRAAQRAGHVRVGVPRRWSGRVRARRQPELVGARGRARCARGRLGARVRVGHGRDRRGRSTRCRVGRQGRRPRRGLQRHPRAAARRRAAGALGRPVFVDVTDTDAVLAACDGAALLWLESPTNPLNGIVDLPAVIAGAHERGCAGRGRQHVRDAAAPTSPRARRRHRGAQRDEAPVRPLRRRARRDRDPRRRAAATRCVNTASHVRRGPRPDGGVPGPARPAHPRAAGRAGPGQRGRARRAARVAHPRRHPCALSGSAPTTRARPGRPRADGRSRDRWSRSRCAAGRTRPRRWRRRRG